MKDAPLEPDFKRFGLLPAKDVRFHPHNLVIGQNGSGKTRFLKALEAHYHTSPPAGTEVITLYFPEISSFFSPDEEPPLDDESTAELATAIFRRESLNFEDFLKLARRDAVALLDDIFLNQNSAKSKGMKQSYEDTFTLLNKKMRSYLGWELENISIEDQYICKKVLDGKQEVAYPLTKALASFSPGELMLFYFSLFLFYLEDIQHSGKKLILIMDEPEQHLHPKALVSLINAIKKAPSVSTLWLATHSLFLLPLFSFEQLVYIKHNRILKLNRNTYQDIYSDLVGLENIDMLELLQSVENWSYYQFISENFLLPVPKSAASHHDIQFRELLKSLESIRSDRPLELLDFGAGKFRIWECFKSELPDREKRNEILHYDAYEPYPDAELETDSDIRLYERPGSLRRMHYDVVVLMNVLHEIDPTEWLQTFQTIFRVLKDDGILVFLEVLSLTNGEQPYGNAGYLLLQDQETKYLFPHATLVPRQEKNKSNCWVIPRTDLAYVTEDRIKETIRLLEEDCEEQLENLDMERILIAHGGKPVDDRTRKMTARQYAFLAQQYINAHIAYKRLRDHITIAVSVP